MGREQIRVRSSVQPEAPDVSLQVHPRWVITSLETKLTMGLRLFLRTQKVLFSPAMQGSWPVAVRCCRALTTCRVNPAPNEPGCWGSFCGGLPRQQQGHQPCSPHVPLNPCVLSLGCCQHRASEGRVCSTLCSALLQGVLYQTWHSYVHFRRCVDLSWGLGYLTIRVGHCEHPPAIFFSRPVHWCSSALCEGEVWPSKHSPSPLGTKERNSSSTSSWHPGCSPLLWLAGAHPESHWG